MENPNEDLKLCAFGDTTGRALVLNQEPLTPTGTQVHQAPQVSDVPQDNAEGPSLRHTCIQKKSLLDPALNLST